jgi:alpha-L-fucosidase
MNTRFLTTCWLLLATLSSRGEINGMTEFKEMNYGFFVHYVWGGSPSNRFTIDQKGNVPASMDALANAFDANGFADDLSSWGVEYVIFTAWHYNINPLFPSQTMRKWGMPEHTCQRDLLGDMISAVSAKGIKVLFYTHPRDGHDLGRADQVKTGWGGPNGNDPDWSKFDYEKWNNFINDLYAELMDRYGKRITGLYLDEGGPGNSYLVVDYPRLRQTIKSRNPHVIILQNYYGSLYSCDIGDKEYCHWGEFAHPDASAWPTYGMAMGVCFAPNWWATAPAGKNAAPYSPEDMFRFTVLQSGVNPGGGGMQWAAGIYAGGSWETGVDETMRKVGSYIRPLEKSLKGVHASDAYPTPKGATLHSITWGIATDARDGSATYLHVLRPPDGPTLHIGMPANGAHFASASLLTTGRAVRLESDLAGYLVTMPENTSWDALDTVIRLQPGEKKQ